MLIDFCGKLSYHRLDVSISSNESVLINGWVGAVVRNNLLAAAEKIPVLDGVSLLALLDNYPLSEVHPLYSVLRGGFPKSFVISILSPERILSSRFRLKPGEEVVFSLILIGSVARYYQEFIEAIRLMCCEGIGTPRTPFQLNEIWEIDGFGRKRRIAVGHMEKILPLSFPVFLENFREERFGEKEKVLKLILTSPLLLTMKMKKKNWNLSYQDKMNGFPSFYQFVRSALFRCLRLTALYMIPEAGKQYSEVLGEMDCFLKEATAALLMKANIRWVRIPGPPRDSERVPMLFSGYVGELIFVGNFCQYVPLLIFMQMLGNGNDTVYGLGHYQVDILEYIKE